MIIAVLMVFLVILLLVILSLMVDRNLRPEDFYIAAKNTTRRVIGSVIE